MSRAIRKAVCLIGLPAVLRRRRAATIVAYHGVVPDQDWHPWATADLVPESLFAQHLAFYRQQYQVVPLRALVAALTGRSGGGPAGLLAITFDDGFRNNFRWAVPLLRRFGFTATFFLTTGFVDGTTDLWWLRLKRRVLAAQQTGGHLEVPDVGRFGVGSPQEAASAYYCCLKALKGRPGCQRLEVLERLNAPASSDVDLLPEVYAPLTWDEARQVARNGMEMGAHTVTHPILAQESTEMAQAEIMQSVRRIQVELGQTDVPFSYPNGQRADFTRRMADMVRVAGCYAAVAGFPGGNTARTNLYELRRFAVGGYHSVEALELDLCGIRPALNRLRRMARKALGGA